MKSLKRFFLSRSTVITLIILMLCVVLTGYFIPQRFLTTPPELEKWRLAHPAFATTVRWFALDHVYTSPWFALLLLLFFASLSLSTVEQFRAAYRRTFSPAGGAVRESRWPLPGPRWRLRSGGWGIFRSVPAVSASSVIPGGTGEIFCFTWGSPFPSWHR
ncbi:cytochrome c biogenesis protein ResB [Geobacter pickeringii]|uniref:cytochrome c biogenesis protein ResB n=1 Tax=Geobacter pickeringii TaxID=345632 RepID=UPI000A65CEA4|nr:cytochrome c biogenesis protein ResB [Geobacter pickeringii]